MWREWDELSAECCSVQIGPNQMAAWHDGEVSEASFVLVKKRLKVKLNFAKKYFIFDPNLGRLGTSPTSANA